MTGSVINFVQPEKQAQGYAQQCTHKSLQEKNACKWVSFFQHAATEFLI
jgi:hypothetical protein